VGVPDRSRGIFQSVYMKQPVQHDEEPMGIVISRGWQPETTPRFAAYVWAPFPDDDEIESEVKAA
jgi:hypothetical protein